MREETNRPEPSRPPWMVSHSVEASWRLYICIPAKSSRDRRDDSASEVPVPTTGWGERRDGESGPALPPGAAGRFGRSRSSRARPGLQPHSPTPRSPALQGDPPGIPQPGTPGTLLSRANARPLGPRTRQLCGERTRRAGPPQRRPPLIRPGDPAGPVTHRARPVVQQTPAARKDGSRTGCRVLCACVSRLRKLASPPSLAFSALARPALCWLGGNIAPGSLPGHRPGPPPSPAPRASAASQCKLHVTLQVTGTLAHSL